ncbi:MAG: HNH endonuclease [Gammaproteobacteria bacterium]|nr:HNH endonuclease [Gammaproteobacteria bacterium]
MSRDYKKEYANYHSKDKQKKRRAARNHSRALMIKKRGASAVAGKDVDHRDRNPNNKSTSNLRIQSKRKNRSRNG